VLHDNASENFLPEDAQGPIHVSLERLLGSVRQDASARPSKATFSLKNTATCMAGTYRSGESTSA